MNTSILNLQTLESFDSRPVSTAPGERRFLCPLTESCRSKPRDGAHRSLCVNSNTGFYVCHRCGAKGQLKDFWEERPRLNKRQLAHLKLAAQFSSPVCKVSEGERQTEHLSESYVQKFDSYRTLYRGSEAEKYLESRGIPAEISRAAGCGFAPAWEHWEKREDSWRLVGVDKRVVFPIFDELGALVAIHGRAITDDYFNSPKITRGDKSRGVFLAAPEALELSVVAICEGAVDALALQACGVAAVALTGTAAPDWLLKKLAFRFCLLATDADEAGDAASVKLRSELEMRAAKTLRLRPRQTKDWAESLEKWGAPQLRSYLSSFAVSATDEIRVNAAYHFYQKQRAEISEFIVATITDVEVREILKQKIGFLGSNRN